MINELKIGCKVIDIRQKGPKLELVGATKCYIRVRRKDGSVYRMDRHFARQVVIGGLARIPYSFIF